MAQNSFESAVYTLLEHVSEMERDIADSNSRVPLAGDYGESLDKLLQHEGGYTNNASDPGGPTNFGITIFDYRKYINPNGTAADVRRMTVTQAKTIYRAKYWDAQHCDELAPGVDYAIFDYGVNSGIGRSAKVLRRLIGYAPGTNITAEVVKAANARPPAGLVNAICDERLQFLRGLSTWTVFGAGWGRRVKEVRATALRMAAAKPVPSAPAKGWSIWGAVAAAAVAVTAFLFRNKGK